MFPCPRRQPQGFCLEKMSKIPPINLNTQFKSKYFLLFSRLLFFPSVLFLFSLPSLTRVDTTRVEFTISLRENWSLPFLALQVAAITCYLRPQLTVMHQVQTKTNSQLGVKQKKSQTNLLSELSWRVNLFSDFLDKGLAKTVWLVRPQWVVGLDQEYMDEGPPRTTPEQFRATPKSTKTPL